jgi:FdhD protein
MERAMKRSILAVPVQRVDISKGLVAPQNLPEEDLVAVEEPLQIRLGQRNIAITMRTPGRDAELAAGFLFTEGILQHADQIESIEEDGQGIVTIRLKDASVIDALETDRNFYMTSSCGICGKASIDALRAAGCVSVTPDEPRVEARVLAGFPEKLRAGQAVFEHTGGLHAAGLFDSSGKLLELREDVGRHNAVDKLIGAAFLANQLPLSHHVLMLSGRISFELVQKAVMAGIPIIAAVGAPSSLAIETALRFRVTLVGFLRNGRFNVYSEPSRIVS